MAHETASIEQMEAEKNERANVILNNEIDKHIELHGYSKDTEMMPESPEKEQKKEKERNDLRESLLIKVDSLKSEMLEPENIDEKIKTNTEKIRKAKEDLEKIGSDEAALEDGRDIQEQVEHLEQENRLLDGMKEKLF